ncbi:MAG: hypothetical protein K9G76_01700 [Bacteroidales bacterium]|nr:hypothetical protein [Bacteroidales bacterium]MCF8403268.1 hypothetical protein [Bacteroidales bacterium]
MDTISVKKFNQIEFEVTVESRITTIHKVSLPLAYYQKLTSGKIPAEILIEKSFEFLLQREPNSSILKSFELSVIGRYFSEFEEVIKSRI